MTSEKDDLDENPWVFGDASASSSTSGDGGAREENSTNHSTLRETALLQQLTLKESKTVWTWKFLVVSTMAILAGFMSTAGKEYILGNQEREFQTEVSCSGPICANFLPHWQVSQIANELERDLDDSMNQFHRTFKNFALWVTAQAPALEHFPYVVISNWELQGMGLRGNVPAIQQVSWCPVVEATGGSGDNFDVWNSFAFGHMKMWLQESIETSGEGILDDDFKPEPLNQSTSSAYPRWQVSPPPADTSILNKEVLDNESIRNLFLAVFYGRSGLFGPRHDGHDQPFVTWIEPVYYDLFDSSSSMAGIVVANISMSEMIRDLLPLDELQAFQVVLRSSCGTFDTFQLQGTEVCCRS